MCNVSPGGTHPNCDSLGGIASCSLRLSAATHLPAAILPGRFAMLDLADASVACKSPAADRSERQCRVLSTSNRTSAPPDRATPLAGPKSASFGNEWFHGPTIALIGAFDFMSMSGTLSRYPSCMPPIRKVGIVISLSGRTAIAPERAIVLMSQIQQRPRRRVEPRSQDLFVERIIRRA